MKNIKTFLTASIVGAAVSRVTVQLPKGLKCESLAFRFQINTNQR